MLSQLLTFKVYLFIIIIIVIFILIKCFAATIAVNQSNPTFSQKYINGRADLQVIIKRKKTNSRKYVEIMLGICGEHVY